MAFFLSPIGNGQQYLSVASQLATAVGGTFNTYLAGTSTPYATFTSSSGASNNPISIAIGANGTLPNPVWIAGGVAIKIIILDALSNAIGPTYDNISGVGDFNAPGNPNAANSISYTAPFAGAVTTTVGAKLSGDWVSVKDFGALGNGSHDDTVAIQAACNTGSSLVFFPNGTYVISSTILPNAHQILLGSSDSVGSPTSIQAAVGMNVPMFKFTAAGKISWISIVGSATGLLTSQVGVYITGTNNVTLDSCLISACYDLVRIDGSTPSFYLNFFDCIFYACIRAQLYVNGSSAAGIDMVMSRTRFLTGGGTYCCYLNGLGSLVWSDVIFTGAVSTNGVMYMDQPASLFGGAQFTNCVFENAATTTGPAVWIVGVTGNRWNQVRMVNCFINGNGTAAQLGLRTSYVDGLYITNSELSSVAAQGGFYIDNGFTLNFAIEHCQFDGIATNPASSCNSSANISGSFVDCIWKGSAALIDYSTAAAVTYLNVLGGNPGTNSTPVKLTTDLTVPGVRMYQTPTNGGWNTYVPTAASTVGAIASYTASGWYIRINKVIHGVAVITVTGAGTGSGLVNISLPATASTGPPILAYGRETVNTGKTLFGYAVGGSGVVTVGFYDNSYPGAVNAVLNIAFTYQIQ